MKAKCQTNSNGSRAGQRRRRRVRRAGAQHQWGISFEVLETRQLMAAVNVNDFGARPNDGGDDSGAIQAAINASRPGDTITFGEGQYLIGNTVRLAGGRSYAGVNRDRASWLKSTDRGVQILYLREDNVSIKYLTLEGKGLFIEKSGGPNTNITIDNNIFIVKAAGPHPNGIEWTAGLKDSRITNNEFHPLRNFGSDHSLVGYGWDNLLIANNEVSGGEGSPASHGFHVLGFDSSRNLTIEQNYFRDITRMTVEYQGGGWNTIVQDNYYEKPYLQSNFHSNDSSLGFSLPSDQSHGLIARRNTLIVPERPDGVGVRMGFEVAGHDFHVYDNWIKGVNHTVAVTNGGANGEIVNNKFDGFIQAAGPNNGGRVNIANNHAGVNLTWNINRGTPGRNRRFGGAPAPEPEPVGQAPIAPNGLAAAAVNATTVNLFWTDRSLNEDGFKIERSTNGQNWTAVKTVGADVSSYSVTGLTAGQAYRFRVCAYNGSGSSEWSNVATVTPSAPDPATGISLSDLNWVTSRNGWGPVERDMTNGETSAGDGRIITIGGKQYDRGLGMHAGAEVHYALNGKYEKFTSDIGVDDEVGDNGSVTFEVWADGVKLYDSGVMTGADATRKVSVDVSGRKELVLVVTNAGDTIDYDHAAWGDPRLTLSTNPTPNPEPDGEPDPQPVPVAAYLSDVAWTSVANGWGTPELDRSNGENGSADGKTITLAGKAYAKGIGVHSNSEVHWLLNGKYTNFTSDIGVDDEVGQAGSVVFQVWADGVKLYDSGKMTGADATKSIKVDVSGKKEMWLVVTDGGDGRELDHADWAGAALSSTGQLPPPAGTTYLSSLTPSGVKNGWGGIELDRSNGEEASGDGAIMRIAGKTYTRGLGVHAASELTYDLDGKYKTFTTDIGVDDEYGLLGSVVFQVWTDGTKAYDSGIVTGADNAKTVTVDVSGKKQLWLVVGDAGDGKDFDHADWADARLAA